MTSLCNFFTPIGELSSILSSWINSLKQYTLITVLAENHICTLLRNIAQFKLVFLVNIQKHFPKHLSEKLHHQMMYFPSQADQFVFKSFAIPLNFTAYGIFFKSNGTKEKTHWKGNSNYLPLYYIFCYLNFALMIKQTFFFTLWKISVNAHF